jgi:uncharacterized tellurite resistance protein B-like protein
MSHLPGKTKDAEAHLNSVIETLRKPSGFALLSSEQRSYLLACLLASVVPVDGKVKPCEMEMLEQHLHTRMQARGNVMAETLTVARYGLCREQAVELGASRLPDLLGIEDRCNLIGMLWDIALCDHELHASEEERIYTIADQAGVPRKKVAEQQARAASRAQ